MILPDKQEDSDDLMRAVIVQYADLSLQARTAGSNLGEFDSALDRYDDCLGAATAVLRGNTSVPWQQLKNAITQLSNDSKKLSKLPASATETDRVALQKALLHDATNVADVLLTVSEKPASASLRLLLQTHANTLGDAAVDRDYVTRRYRNDRSDTRHRPRHQDARRRDR